MSLPYEIKRNAWLSYPIILGMVGHVTVGIIDNLMVGRLGAEALGGVSIANSCLYPFLVFAIGVSTAMTPLISKMRGEGNINDSRDVFTHGMLLNGIIGLLMIPLFEGVIACMPYMGQSQEVLNLAVPYLRIVSYSIFPIMIFQSIRQSAEGLAYTTFNIYTSLVVNLLNVLFNYIFIFGKLGFDPMGVNGAAYGSLMARFLLIPIGILVAKNHLPLWQTISRCNWKKYQMKLLQRLWNLGYSTGFQMFFETTAFAAAAIFAGMIGTEALAAHQIGINLAVVSFTIAQGISSALMIRTGFHYGGKNALGLRFAIKAGYINTLIVMAGCGITFILAKNYLPTLFTDDRQVIEIAAQLLFISAMFQLSDGLQVVGLGGLRGLQDVKIPMMIVFGCYWFISLPVGYIFGVVLEYGVAAVWWGLAVGLTVAAVSLRQRLSLVRKRLLPLDASI